MLRIELRGGTAVAIVPNYNIVFLVFIGFYWFFLRPLRGINSHSSRRNYVLFHPHSTEIRSFQPRNLWFPAEKPMVSRQETFKTHVVLKL
jgi:hypothetical protein